MAFFCIIWLAKKLNYIHFVIDLFICRGDIASFKSWLYRPDLILKTMQLFGQSLLDMLKVARKRCTNPKRRKEKRKKKKKKMYKPKGWDDEVTFDARHLLRIFNPPEKINWQTKILDAKKYWFIFYWLISSKRPLLVRI